MQTERMGRTLTDILDFFLPPACAGCGGATDAESGPVCRTCRFGLPSVPLPHCPRCRAPMGTGQAPSCYECAQWPDKLVGAQAVCLLASPARELVHALKYQGWRRVGTFIGQEMARQAVPQVIQADIITPIPTSARNEKRRGYNQARVIAEALAQVLSIPIVFCLERRNQQGTQTALNPMQRKANVSEAFVLSPEAKSKVKGRRVVLVDDVITTGATLQAAVHALAPGSPASVFAYAFARTVPLSLEANPTSTDLISQNSTPDTPDGGSLRLGR